MFGRRREAGRSGMAQLMDMAAHESGGDLGDLHIQHKQFDPPGKWLKYEQELAFLDIEIMKHEKKFLALSEEKKKRFILLLFLTIIFEGTIQERTIEMPGGEVGSIRKRENKIREGVKIIPSFSQDPPKVSYTIVFKSGESRYFDAKIPQTQEEIGDFIYGLSAAAEELVGILQ